MSSIGKKFRSSPLASSQRFHSLVDISLFLFFVAGAAYLVAKVYSVSGTARYDFRFFWLAGELWLRGVSPYGPDYTAIGQQLITSGYVPHLLAYPPNWFIPSVLLSLLDLELSSIVFNTLNVLMLLASSALLISAFQPLEGEPEPGRPGVGAFQDYLRTPRNLFFLHAGVLCVLQASALTLSVGQNSILIYFGASLLIYGVSKERDVAAIAGLAIIFLKPQLGILLAIPLMFSTPHRLLVVKAVVVSAIASLPAFFVSPGVVFEWLANIGPYDSMNTANLPETMTGIRNLLFDISGIEMSNAWASIAALIIMTVLYVFLFRTAGRPGQHAHTDLNAIAFAAAVTLALAPLHVYDFVLVGIVLFPLVNARLSEVAIGAVGAALIWRAGDLALVTGFYDKTAEHFEGSRLSTLGAMLMLIAVLIFLWERRTVANS